MDNFFDTYGVSKERFVELCQGLQDGATPDCVIYNLNFLRNKYKLDSYAISNCTKLRNIKILKH